MVAGRYNGYDYTEGIDIADRDAGFDRTAAHSDPGPENCTYKKRDPAERFASRLVRQDNGCLEFTTKRGKRIENYGFFNVDCKEWRAHRYAWYLANGQIPDGMYVCHRCDNPPCCDVTHLFLGTHDENMKDMVAKGRQFNGHGGRHEVAEICLTDTSSNPETFGFVDWYSWGVEQGWISLSAVENS